MKLQRPERLLTGLTVTGLVTLASLLLGFLLGLLGGIADPSGGWAAWRVGLLVGASSAGAALVCGAVGTLMYVVE